MIDTQVVFSARMSRVKVFAGIAAGVFAGAELAPARLLADSAWDGVVGSARKVGGDIGAVDNVIVLPAGEGVFAGEMVDVELFPDDKVNVSAGCALLPLGEGAAPERWGVGDVGAATETGDDD
jgi:hypothetical protein